MKDKKHRIKSIKVNAILNVTKQLCKVVFPLITMPYVTRVLQASDMENIILVARLLVILYFSQD